MYQIEMAYLVEDRKLPQPQNLENRIERNGELMSTKYEQLAELEELTGLLEQNNELLKQIADRTEGILALLEVIKSKKQEKRAENG